ncbi:hypothetical protein [Streptomyces sp. SD15]
MSNSAAYEWTYVDVEAERRRDLRAQLAQETTRSRDLRGQAKSLRRAYGTDKIDVYVVTVASGADSTELAAALESARRINQRAEADLSRAAADVWSLPPAETEQRKESRPAARPAPVSADRAGEDRAARARASALVEAEALLKRDGPACEPDDLPVFARRLEALRQARGAEEARTLFHDLGVLVHKSTQRQRNAARTAALRAALLDRLEDAAPEDRERLATAVAEAPDPAHLEREVEWAVAREDTARYRSAVADTVMRVLRERDYAVGDDFADLLAEDGSVVVPFGAAAEASGEAAVPDGYGLRVVLAPDRPGLTTVLVAETETEAETDHRVQQWFCEGQLPTIEDAVRAQGVELARKSALPPGVRPTAVVPDGSWPDTGRAHDRTEDQADETGRVDQTDQADETGRTEETGGADETDRAEPRRKKKAKPARRTSYGQEWSRER